MKGFENEGYLLAYILSNAFALLLLFLSRRQPKAARVLFVALFAWAGWVNWRTALFTPHVYLDYADLSFLNWYKHLILGRFSNHILLAVGAIATCQLLIAIGLLLKGAVYKMATIGAVVFLIAILPLGVGAAFPCTLIMAIALLLLWKQGNNYIWQHGPRYTGLHHTT